MIWAVRWRSRNTLDGETRHLLHANGVPALFKTRRKAREYAAAQYGYIKTQADLRREPHGWRMPQPVKVKLVLA